MKKSKTMVFIAVWFLILSGVTFAEMYFAVGGGAGGKAGAPNVTFDIGYISTYKKPNYLIAGGGSVIFTNNIPANVLDYPVPHWDYTNLGTRQTNESALFVKGGLEVIKNQGVFIFLLGGFSFLEKIQLARSNITGWYYTQASHSRTYGLLGVGLGYFLPNSRLSFSVEYDNRRGVTGSLGYRWNLW